MINRRWLMLSLALAAALFFAVTPAALAQATGTIKGKVTNETAQGDTVVGQTVELLAFADGAQKDKRTATVAEDGTFSFDGLATAGLKYLLTITYQGVTYHSDEVDLSTGEPTREVNLVVYDATPKADQISIGRSHMILDFDPETKSVLVLEAMIVNNSGDRAYVGEEELSDGLRKTLRLQLPKGAQNVRFSEGLSEQRSVYSEGAVVDTTPVPPGARQLVLTYSLPYKAGSAALTRSLDYPIERVIILVRDVGAKVTSEGLAATEMREVGGSRYVQLSANNLAPGRPISVRLEGIPAAVPEAGGTAGGGQGPTVWAAGGLAGLGLALGIAYPVLRRRRSAAAETTAAPTEVSAEWDRLVQSIAALDDEFEAGRVPEADYRRQRAEQKARLLELSRRVGKA